MSLTSMFLMTRLPVSSTFFPYTTLFRSDLTIRCKNFDTSNLMGDNKGNIIADLKPSLGINDEDVYDGAILSYLDGKGVRQHAFRDRKSTRLNSSHVKISYAVFCLKKKKI